jgi:hypothetical protein
MSGIVELRAPWPSAVVKALNETQAAGAIHPFTCGRDSKVLVATGDGWVCPKDGCEYTQDWAHPFMITHAARTSPLSEWLT